MSLPRQTQTPLVPPLPAQSAPALVPSIDTRIEQLRSEIDAIISLRVESIAKDCSGIPHAVLRNLLIGNNAGCQCSQYLALAGQ